MFAFLGTTEIVIVLAIALLVFGPAKLPEIGRQIGSAMRELRKMSSDVQRALDLDDTYRDDSRYERRYEPASNTYPYEEPALSSDTMEPAKAIAGESVAPYDAYEAGEAHEAVASAVGEEGLGKSADSIRAEDAEYSGAAAATLAEPPGPPSRRERL